MDKYDIIVVGGGHAGVEAYIKTGKKRSNNLCLTTKISRYKTEINLLIKKNAKNKPQLNNNLLTNTKITKNIKKLS